MATTSPKAGPSFGDGTARHWTLIVDPARPGAENMQIDLRLLLDLEAERQPRSVLRLYRWSRPTVSVGKHQQLERAADLEACARLGVPVVRRPTGGRAVLHAQELTYAVLSNDPALFGRQGVMATYRSLAAALQQALGTVGAECRLARPPGKEGTSAPLGEVSQDVLSPSPARGRQTPCFTAPNRYELLVRGRKVAGSAQRRLKRAFLQHGSIPLQVDYALMAEVLGSDPQVLRRTLVSVSEAAGRQVSFRQLAQAMAQAFREIFPGCWSRRC